LADRMEQALLQSRRSSKLVAVALIDLDGFKAVNDLHGHDAGDVLLKTVSQRMTESLRAEDTVARLGGDEFVVVMSALDSRSDIEQPIARLLAAINQPVALDNATVKVSGSIGVTFYPQREPIAPDQLMRQADQAMYIAKQAGKNLCQVFDDRQDL
ncbi:GGDEF domain-containing protein, partial [Thauera sp. UPWRP]